ncbi:hypothetical protein HRR83_002041 [Exophiala dermatitidis]|uniref:Non-homologous end-joining factor 1 n=1 Tax=Exophiala dermatitidis TaxID=5970 RepID=A0AAN6EWH1_EXODE|nr:hypothetical protein HRR75_001943 [Exophiala dermatitidis]KAJ4523923.1 hypothetical protein HRR74_002118 [Exophiala dermatitidis]KAJ4525805.1 hypothetical protein HRR73_002537 [Exophiala dermatitidis]KAJ4537135.1 hypothetical protein HRR76_005150 [Exophiala dermatitidis]KAJ4555267.1 hypothetical protein HRR77_001205 [Exophiala dermatitidis]
MPETGSEGWQELQLPSKRQCPKLFYSLSTENESITLLLTDLIGIWECILDRYDILAEASRQHTSIDPSASSDQFEVLLSKITKSLKDGNNVLLRADGRDGNNQVLRLKTSIQLPKPLRPLEWTFKLTPQPASELAERILRPSLHEVAVSQEKIASLLHIIKEKDHVISRLLDRIGSSAIDLSLIFPGITGVASRRAGGHISVAEAKKHVPGMAAFDEKSWTKQFANDDGYEGADRTGLSNLVRGCEKCFVHTKAEHEDWIGSLPPADRLDAQKNRQSSPPPTTKSTSNKRGRDSGNDESTDSDDDFERQPTPPALRSKASETMKSTRAANNDVSEDEEPPSKRTKASKIGGLGRRNATKAFGTSNARQRSPSPPPATEQTPSRPARRRATSTSSTGSATASPTASEDEDDNDNDNDSKSQPSKHQARKDESGTKRQLGGLRKNKQASPSPPATRNTTRGRHASTPDHESPEPSGEGADNRRATGTESGTDSDSDSAPVGSKRRTGTPKNPSVKPKPTSTSTSTPPSKSTPKTTTKPDSASDTDSTADDDLDLDLDDPKPQPNQNKNPTHDKQTNPEPKSSQISPSSAAATTPRRRLGRIGRNQPSQSQPSQQPTPTPRRKRGETPNDDDDQRQSADRDRSATSSPSPSPSAPRSTSKSKPIPSQRDTTTTTARAASQWAKSLSSIADTESQSTKENLKSSQPPQPPPPKAEEQETDEQKANRRRMELKRVLAGANGTKKKRRF